MTPSPLAPEHRDDLRRSGLSDAAIHALGIRSLAPGEWPRYCSPALIAKVNSLLLFPYPGTDAFYRLKLFPAVSDGDGHHVRYYQPARTPPAFYIPPTTRAMLADPGVELFVCEGEKKAAKADQEKLPAIGLGGLWNWRHAGRPIVDFDLIDCFERSVLLVPDTPLTPKAGSRCMCPWRSGSIRTTTGLRYRGSPQSARAKQLTQVLTT